jgi:hypothetical protein
MKNSESGLLNETNKEIQIDETEEDSNEDQDQTFDSNSYRFMSIKSKTTNKKSSGACYYDK